MPKIKASFVIPVYNGQAFLAQTIESCLRQTEKKIEVVIVNDGSTDSTQRIIDHYRNKDERVRCIINANGGRSKARNEGNQAAKGDVILVLDADDIAASDRVAQTLKYMKKNPGVDIVYGQFNVLDAVGRFQEGIDAMPFDYERVKTDKFTYICHSTMAYKKAVADKIKYDEGEPSKLCIDDWFFQVSAYKAGFKFGAIKKVLTGYRVIPKARDEAKILQVKEQCLAAA